MKKELEICVRALIDFKELKKKMMDMGFIVQEDFQLNDIYMIDKEKEILLKNANDIFSNYVLIREVVGKSSLLVLKEKQINDNGEITFQKSTRCQIESIEDGYLFMKKIGYKKLLELKNHNILLSNGKNEIYIQDVLGLGTYIEMEQKNLLLDNNNGNTLGEMIDNLKKYNLPIDTEDFFVKKAHDMLLNILK